MAEDLLLSLRSWPSSDATDSVPFLISQINQQRGSFLDVTEGSLVEEIRAVQAGDDIVEEENAGDTADAIQDTKSKREELSAARLEILRQVTMAHTESTLALEFVSLLLSKHTPVQAQLTLSPYLKQNMPMGSLGAAVMQAPQVTDEDKHDDEVVSLGWKMQSLGNTADSLLKSATRLKQEIEYETRYWEQVLAIKEEGWSLCRLPREKHTLAVRYGFAEAYSDFRDRGLAALRRDEEGNIVPDHGIRSQSRRLRIRILQKGVPIVSDEIVDDGSPEDLPIEKSILQARNSIFDEELYHELNREARNLVNQGVRCVGDAIVLPYEAEKQLEISLVPLGSRDLKMSRADTHNAIYDIHRGDSIIIRSIAISLRILLSHAHYQNLAQRSQPPPPIRETKPTRPIYAILKPILEVVRHRSYVRATRILVENLGKTLLAAKLNLSIEDLATSPNLANLPFLAGSATTSAAEALVTSLTAPLHSSLTFRFPTNSPTLKIELHTSFLPPTIGTTYKANIISSPTNSPLANLPQTMHFSSHSDLEDHILHLVTLDLVSLISTDTAFGSQWTSISPYNGQLVHRNGERKVAQTFILLVEKERLSLEWRRVTEGSMDSSRTLRWGGGEEMQDGKKGLLGAIGDALNCE